MSRLGEARPTTRKLRCRCEISARWARSSCDQPRRCRHHRSAAAKPFSLGMNTSQVVAATMPSRKMPHPFSSRQGVGLGLGGLIAIVSSALGGRAGGGGGAGVARYLGRDADPLTLPIRGGDMGFLWVLPPGLFLARPCPPRQDWPAVAALGICFFGLFFIFYNIAIGYTTAARAS